MERGKLIPLLLAGLLIISAIALFFRYRNKQVIFNNLDVIYNSETTKYSSSDLKVDNIIVVNGVSFWIVSINKNQVALTSSSYLSNGVIDTNEFVVSLSEEAKACFSDNECITFVLE